MKVSGKKGVAKQQLQRRRLQAFAVLFYSETIAHIQYRENNSAIEVQKRLEYDKSNIIQLPEKRPLFRRERSIIFFPKTMVMPQDFFLSLLSIDLCNHGIYVSWPRQLDFQSLLTSLQSNPLKIICHFNLIDHFKSPEWTLSKNQSQLITEYA